MFTANPAPVPVSALDPHTGFGYFDEKDVELQQEERMTDGIVSIGPMDADMRIAVLGGSTSAPSFADNWPRKLYHLLKKNGRSVCIYNCAVPGYSSHQELIKLIRDVSPLQPKVVLALNGVNDFAPFHFKNNHPMSHPYQSFVCETIVSKQREFGIRDIYNNNNLRGVNFGVKYSTELHVLWLRNVRFMRALCVEMGIPYHCFLQPVIGIGNYHTNEEELQALDLLDKRGKGRYLSSLKNFYHHAIQYAKELDYVHDLTSIFDGMEQKYKDVRHLNEGGNTYLTECIANIVNDNIAF